VILGIVGRFAAGPRKSLFGLPTDPLPNCNKAAQSFRSDEAKNAI
jgi:hypothetical protein